MPIRTSRSIISILLVLLLLTLSLPATSQARDPLLQDAEPAAYAEAITFANVRSGPGIDFPTVGQIEAGTRYPVVQRHALVPWIMLEVPGADTPYAWVYVDVVTITGNLALVPTTNSYDEVATPAPLPTATLPPAPAETVSPDATAQPGGATATPTFTPSPTLTPTIQGAVATIIGEANIRFGPDISYPVIVKVDGGRSFQLLEMHTLVPWARIRLPESPTGSGWVYTDLIDITGDMSTVQLTNASQFSYPTLTPTPQTVLANLAPWESAPLPAGQLAIALGDPMHNYLLDQGFAPYSERMASVFVMDLSTGDNFALNDGVAFSGMSLTKIPILAAFFERFPGPYDADMAFLIADTMMCSENITTNQLLTLLGDGEPLTGAQRVSAFMQSLGLTGTFIMRQYVTNPDEPPIGITTLTTGADQTSAEPDLYNQVVPKELGWLLASIYQCALDGTGLLTERYPDSFDEQVCRQMLYAMDANEIGVFLEAGTPRGTTVIHKHGWVDDTHGDAGIVIGPSRTYVFVAVLHARNWLEFDQSSPIIGELARMTWNAFNPSRPMNATTFAVVPEFCDPRSNSVMSALMSTDLPMPGP